MLLLFLESMVNKMLLNSNQIQEIIPHRYPFLLVDQVLDIDIENKEIKALKNVSANEMQFMGHFQNKHVMPGVLIIEALAQAGAVLLLSEEQFKDKLVLFAGIDKCRFKRQVIPGDTLILEVKMIKMKGVIGIAKANAYVNEEIAVSCEMKFAVEI